METNSSNRSEEGTLHRCGQGSGKLTGAGDLGPYYPRWAGTGRAAPGVEGVAVGSREAWPAQRLLREGGG